MPTRNVNLTEHFDQFIGAGINSGRFSNASEMVREGLRLLERREQEDEAKIQWLRDAAKEGFEAADGGGHCRTQTWVSSGKLSFAFLVPPAATLPPS